MKINIKPAAYLLAGVGGPDFLSKNRDIAQSYCASTAYGNSVEPLHPESLVIELAEALAAMDEAYCNAGSDMSREDRHAGRVALIKARALFAKITAQTSEAA